MTYRQIELIFHICCQKWHEKLQREALCEFDNRSLKGHRHEIETLYYYTVAWLMEEGRML